MIQEAYGDWKKNKTPEEIAAIEAKDKSGRAKMVVQKKARAVKSQARRPKREKAATPRQPRRDAPPPPPAAGSAPAQAAEAPDANTYRGKSGKRLSSAPALTRMAKRAREGKINTGDQESPGGSIHDKIDALHQSIQQLHQAVREPGSRGKTIPYEGLPAGRRRDMSMPRGEVPGDHGPNWTWNDKERKHAGFGWNQKQKQGDLAALEKDRQKRGAPIRKKAGALVRARLKHPAFRHREPGQDADDRDREKDVAKGYSPDEHSKWAGHHTGPDGEPVHSSGKKANKKFANATTFTSSDDDAMLHTDKSKEGSRASADDDEFVFKGDTEKDPRNKWFRVSKEGGRASAMGSLRKAYTKGKTARSKVVAKVKSTGFTDSSGHQIDIKPTGSLHNERGACVKKPAVRDKDGNVTTPPRLTAVGKELKSRNPSEFYRLCKGSHAGVGGTKLGRSEYGSTKKDASGATSHTPRPFDPQHDDQASLRRLHKAAEDGKGSAPPPPWAGGRKKRSKDDAGGGDIADAGKSAAQRRRETLVGRVRRTGAQAEKTSKRYDDEER